MLKITKEKIQNKINALKTYKSFLSLHLIYQRCIKTCYKFKTNSLKLSHQQGEKKKTECSKFALSADISVTGLYSSYNGSRKKNLFQNFSYFLEVSYFGILK